MCRCHRNNEKAEQKRNHNGDGNGERIVAADSVSERRRPGKEGAPINPAKSIVDEQTAARDAGLMKYA